ncbi:MAG: NAD(P)/FAD-dependent oxidoreductase [Thermoproteota archaeon]|nr:NAD(P)/FAD-dependent oxidoreductase [Thermoproteota archaeon]
MSLSKTDYDIIVAGGGLAGLIVASSAAYYSKQRLKILVIDRNSIDIQGRKTISGWICGDAVGKNTVDYMTERIKISWGFPEIEHPVKGVVAFSPDHETKVFFDGEGYILNRKKLPQKQLTEATKLGVEIMNNSVIRQLITDNNFIVGVEGENSKTRETFKKSAKVVVDCTGVTSVLRTNLPIKSHIQRRIDRNDLESTGRYIYDFDTQGKEDKTYFDPDYCIIHLDQNLAPGGYGWVFPKGSHKVNIGLGVQQKLFDKSNKELGKKRDLKKLIDDYVGVNPVINNPRLSNGEQDQGNEWGTWQVSVRRQNDCMVANGYILVGDSA